MNFIFKPTEEYDYEFDRWIEIQSELEKYHLSSIAAYVKGNTEDQNALINYDKLYKDYKEVVAEETDIERSKICTITLEEFKELLEGAGYSLDKLKVNEVQKVIDLLFSDSRVRWENAMDKSYVDYNWLEMSLMYELMLMLQMVLENPDKYSKY